METGRKGKNGNAGTSSSYIVGNICCKRSKRTRTCWVKPWMTENHRSKKGAQNTLCRNFVYWICQPISDNYWEYHLLKGKSSFFLNYLAMVDGSIYLENLSTLYRICLLIYTVSVFNLGK